MKNVFVKLVCIVLFLCSCHEQKQEKARLEKKTIDISELPYDASANTTTDNYFQESIDSLRKLWLNSEDSVYLKKIEIIAAKSDGEKSEYMDVTLVSMFRNKPAPLIAYLVRNKKSELYSTLTNGLGAELFVYSKDERVAKKNQIKQDAIKLSNGKLTKNQLKFMDQLFRDVVPEKFD